MLRISSFLLVMGGGLLPSLALAQIAPGAVVAPVTSSEFSRGTATAPADSTSTKPPPETPAPALPAPDAEASAPPSR
mgnify:CR=1 FL=1